MTDVCPRCVAAIERADRIEQDMLLVEEEKRGLLRRINALTTELKRQRREHPDAAKARALFDHWTVVCHKNARTVYGEAREKVLLARLKQFDEDQLRQAIDGAAAMPYVGDGGRQPHPGGGARRYDELTLILRDETTVERFMGYASPEREQLHEVRTEPASTLTGWLCDCGHPMSEHIPPRLLSMAAEKHRLTIPAHYMPCAHGSCDCVDFSELVQQAERFIADQQADRRRREMRRVA